MPFSDLDLHVKQWGSKEGEGWGLDVALDTRALVYLGIRAKRHLTDL